MGRRFRRTFPTRYLRRRWPVPPRQAKGAASALSDRARLLAHAQAICGLPISREITPELRRALALKPRPEDFM